MGIRRGSISTPIIADGLVLNIDAANRASTIPISTVQTVYNTVNISQSGSIVNEYDMWDNSTITPTFAFDGNADYINLENQINFGGYSEITHNVWVKYPDTTTNGIFHRAAGQAVGIWIQSGTDVYYYIKTGSWSGLSASGVGTNTWYNISCTYNSSEMSIYVNGDFKNSTSKSGTISDNGSDFYIGYLAGIASYAFNGNIGPIQIYNRALSANEVLHNYNALKSRFE
jgi:hypothetical protein